MTTVSATKYIPANHTALAAKLSQVKKALTVRLSRDFGDRLPGALIRRAIEEADELARSTGFPHLVLPLLAEETVRRVAEFSFSADSLGEPALAVA